MTRQRAGRDDLRARVRVALVVARGDDCRAGLDRLEEFERYVVAAVMARLGDILVRRGYITAGQLDSALSAQGSERGMLGRILVRRGLVTLDQLGDALAEQFGVPFVEIVPQAVNPQVVRLLPEKLARQRSCVPIGVATIRRSTTDAA